MNTLEFFQRVLPSEGFYVSTVINPDGTKQGFFTSVDELAKATIGLDHRGNNTYFALSAFTNKGNRKQDNVRATKVIALDVDCGDTKPFPTWKEGLHALGNFTAHLKLPKPMVIYSGNGLHVYWVLTDELAPAQWQPIANAMKAAALGNNFAIDPAVPADSARVLRPVGTRNPKGGNTVKLLIDAPSVDPAVLVNCLSNYMISIPGVAVRSTSNSKLLQNLAVESDIPAAISHVVEKKCQQVSWCSKNQGEVSEPLWYDMLGIAAYCIDPENTAIEWSQHHPSYNASATLRKLSHWKQSTTGPTTCSKFEIDRPGGCKGCKFKDKIGTPARLGVHYQEVAPAVDVLSTTASDVALPKPFKRTAVGIKIVIDETDIDVCPFDIYPVSYGRDESLHYETVRYHWNRPHVGWQELIMRQAYLTDGHREFVSTIADQGIVLYNKRQTEFFQLMLRSYMDELRQKRAMTNLYATMGWKDNFTRFVIGDTIIQRDSIGVVTSESISLAAGSQRLGSELYGTAGNIKDWTSFTSVLEKAELPGHMFALGVGLSSPLYAFTGLKGLTVSLYGPTGGGKTLAQYLIQSIWGNPDKLHFAAKFTQNTLFGRMGMYAHMPMTIDEVTMMVDKEVGDFAYWVSQGRDKARLTRSAEERDAKTWAMPVIVSTNKSLQSKLIASGLDTDAQMARILEVSIPSHKLFTRDSTAGRKFYNFTMDNYGTVGHAFITKLLELGPEGIRAAITEATETFQKKYKSKFSGEERYWEQAIILQDLASRMAHSWGLISYDYSKGTDWVLSQIGAIRRSVSENKVDSFDLLSEYLNDSADTAVTLMHTGSQKPTLDYSRVPRADIRIRFDIYRKTTGDQFDHGTIMLDRTHFRRWLSTRGADYKVFVQDLTDENIIATPKSHKAFLGKDTPVKLGQAYVVGVNLNHPRLQGILDDMEQSIDNISYGQMKSI